MASAPLAVQKIRAPRNRTVVLGSADIAQLAPKLMCIDAPVSLEACLDRTIFGNCFDALPNLPRASVDLLIADPPYNMDKRFGSATFREMATGSYEEWLDGWLTLVAPVLKPTASIYVCSEWRSSGAVQKVLEKRFQIRNRITWEREKGRGASKNWKNASEDIWFCTIGSDFHFDVEAVKSKRRVVAPYRNASGTAKGWKQEESGAFRLTSPSNLWNDISVPFWSMPENTDHPTQKPEKLVAKLILASSRPGDVILDPFLGSGTTSVVARKLGRHFIGIESEQEYCLFSEERLRRAASDKSIQGYEGGVFLERNTLMLQEKQRTALHSTGDAHIDLFEGDHV